MMERIQMAVTWSRAAAHESRMLEKIQFQLVYLTVSC